MNNPNPYETPKTHSRQLADGSYRPRVTDWLILLILLPVVCGLAFFATCFGTTFALIGVVGIHSNVTEGLLIIPFGLGAIAAFGVGRFIVKRYFRTQRRWYQARMDMQSSSNQIVEASTVNDDESA